MLSEWHHAEFAIIALCNTVAEAHILHGMLESVDIPAILRNEYLGGVQWVHATAQSAGLLEVEELRQDIQGFCFQPTSPPACKHSPPQDIFTPSMLS